MRLAFQQSRGLPTPIYVKELFAVVATTVLLMFSSTVVRAAEAHNTHANLRNGVTSPKVQEAKDDRFLATLHGGQLSVAINTRFEWVDDNAFDPKAQALTARTRINYKTDEWQGWQLFAEVDAVADLGVDRFNGGAGTTPGRARYPIVADPNDQRVNQLWLAYHVQPSLTIKAGRQRIKYDNDRFIGNVGWRQNEQTYDAIRLSWNANAAKRRSLLRLHYDYVDQVNRIFGKDVAAAEHAHSTHLFNLAYQLGSNHAISTYGYYVDTEDAPTFSTRTVGMRYTGTGYVGEYDWAIAAEYAQQSDLGDNPDNFVAYYWLFEPTLTMRPWASLMLGVETLSGDSMIGGAFRTPLATLHAFNGFADQFLVTPDAGLTDVYLGYKGKHDRLAWSVTWHQFDEQVSSQTYGSELDAALTFTPRKGLDLLLKSAAFNATRDGEQSGFRDVHKLWAQVTIAF